MKYYACTALVVASGLTAANPVSHTNVTRDDNLNPNGEWSWELDLDVSGMHFNDIQGSAFNEFFHSILVAHISLLPVLVGMCVSLRSEQAGLLKQS